MGSALEMPVAALGVGGKVPEPVGPGVTVPLETGYGTTEVVGANDPVDNQEVMGEIVPVPIVPAPEVPLETG
jgi:hypothetical protein